MYSTRGFRYVVAHVVLLVVIVWVAVGVVGVVGRATGEGDWLVYKQYLHDIHQSQLVLYDPNSGFSLPIYSSYNGIGAVRLSPDGYIAFSQSNRLFLTNVVADGSTLMDLSVFFNADAVPLGWSEDGRYLAVQRYNYTWKDDIFNFEYLLYLWDNEEREILNITPDDMIGFAEEYSIAWGPNNDLLFRVRFGHTELHPPAEIYLWNGDTTINLSQNPDGNDRYATWSNDGRVMYLSTRSDQHQLLVSDTPVTGNKHPNIGAFSDVGTDMGLNFKYPIYYVWNQSDDIIIYTALDGSIQQIFLWDGNTLINISQTPELHSGGGGWHSSGNWAFSTFWSGEQLVFVRDSNNNTLLEIYGQFGPSWSSDGKLIFCQRGSPGTWALMMWDGTDVVAVFEQSVVEAYWSGGQPLYCSSG